MDKLNVYLFVVFFIRLLGTAAGWSINAEVSTCNPPDFPLYGGYQPVKKIYQLTDIVYYFCDTDALMSGNFLRTCELDGNWTGDTPFCDKAAELLTFYQSTTMYPESANKADLAVDNDHGSCSSTNIGLDKFWMGLFKKPGQLVQVHVLMPKGNQSFEVFSVLHNHEKESCGKQIGKIDHLNWMVYNCSRSFVPIGEEAIGFQIKSLSLDPLTICKVFAHVLTSPSCTDPHLRVKNGRLQLSRKIGELICDDGYVKGSRKPYECVTIPSTGPYVNEGIWKHAKLFCVACTCVNGTAHTKDGKCICINGNEDEDCKNRKGCLPPGPILSPLSVALSPPNNSLTAVYSCLEGYVLKGSAVSICQGNNTWSSNPPVCLNVCEEPPIPIGGSVNYLLPRHVSGQSGSLKWAKLSSSLALIRDGHREDGFLPQGLHGIGEVAKFDCENKYYELVGSKHRRCRGKNEWTGNPPICIPVCGRSDDPRIPSIFNGNVSNIGQWPWQAGISRYFPDKEKWFISCGGSLLSTRWVITAAHCLTYKGTNNPIEKELFRIYLGKHYRDDKEDDEYVQVGTIEEMHIHPDYDQFFLDSDIALIKLSERVQLNARVRPVCLPSEKTSKKNLVEGKRGVITGWGKIENNHLAESLQQAVLLFVSNSVCEKNYLDEWNISLTVTDNMFCAGYSSGVSRACMGDSGSPFVFLDDSIKEKTWVLEGIVSWSGSKYCNYSHQYGGFTAVHKFLDWIHYYF